MELVLTNLAIKRKIDRGRYDGLLTDICYFIRCNYSDGAA